MGKIFGIGLGKTGTTSLNSALRVLGFRSLHFPLAFQFELAEAFTDEPVSARFEFLDKAYPGSKFILTVRDFTSWLDSYERQAEKEKAKSLQPIYRDEVRFCWQTLYGTTEFSRPLWTVGYNRYHDKVRDYFRGREKDLLILDVCGGEGWSRLCSFLERPTPLAEFPHQNTDSLAYPNPMDGVDLRIGVRQQKFEIQLTLTAEVSRRIVERDREFVEVLDSDGGFVRWGHPVIVREGETVRLTWTPDVEQYGLGLADEIVVECQRLTELLQSRS